MTENNKIDFETIDYSKVNPKKLNGNKHIVKSYLIYFAFDVVLTVAKRCSIVCITGFGRYGGVFGFTKRISYVVISPSILEM